MAVYRLPNQRFERQSVEKKKNKTWCLTIYIGLKNGIRSVKEHGLNFAMVSSKIFDSA